MIRAAVIGASGYVGGELLRILLCHPEVKVTCATSREYANEYVFRLHSNLRGLTDLRFSMPEHLKIAEGCDVVFTAVPHGASAKIVPQYLQKGLKVIDLSADFRLKDPSLYQAWYGWRHPNPELLREAVYGMPELHKEEIKEARLVAVPGCIPTGAIMALAPVIKAGVVERNRIVIDSKIGSSGAGGRPSLATHHAERFGVVRAYKPVGHRHTAEIEQELNRLSEGKVVVSLSPHAVNMVRGIMTTVHTFLAKPVKIQEVWRMYRSFYQGQPFIRLVKDRRGLYRNPDPKIVVGSNFCDIGFEVDGHADRLVLMSAIDNLMKGAAGQAVQAMNIMLGIDERVGLEFPGLHPV